MCDIVVVCACVICVVCVQFCFMCARNLVSCVRVRVRMCAVLFLCVLLICVCTQFCLLGVCMRVCNLFRVYVRV